MPTTHKFLNHAAKHFEIKRNEEKNKDLKNPYSSFAAEFQSLACHIQRTIEIRATLKSPSFFSKTEREDEMVDSVFGQASNTAKRIRRR